MRIINSILGSAVAFGLSAAAAFADDELVCNLFLDNDFVIGNYEMTLGPGSFTVGALLQNYPKQHVLDATISTLGDEMILVSEQGFNMTFKDVEFDERDWNFEAGDFGMSVSASDFALSVGCADANEMPRLQATGMGSYFANDGVEVPTMMKLFVYRISEAGVHAFGGIRVTAPHGAIFELHVRLVPN